MDFLIELVLDIIGGIIEFFFGETPIKRLPRPLRFIILFVFWFGLAAFFFWFSYLAYAESVVFAVVLGVLGAAMIVGGILSIVRSMQAVES